MLRSMPPDRTNSVAIITSEDVSWDSAGTVDPS